MTQDEINELSKQSFLRGEIENRRDFSVGFKSAQSKMYSEEDMKNAFDSGREFNSLDGVVDVHIVLPMGGDVSDLQPLYPTFTEYFETIKKK